MFCKRCGKELAEGSKFCSSCGAEVETSATTAVPKPGPARVAPPQAFAPPPVYPAAKPKKSMGPLIVGIVVGAVVLFLLLVTVIAVPVYLNSRKNAQLRTCQANLRTIDGAISSYYAEYEKNPEDVETLVDARFLKKVPTCPSGPLPYTLEVDDEGNYDAHCPNDPNHSY